MQWLLVRVLVLGITIASAGCGSSPPPERELITVARRAGAWEGTGNTSIGLVSDTGRFRIHWQTRRDEASAGGTFRLTVHSAVSGRPIQVVVDHEGEGSGQTEFADDPRPYDLMVESADVTWSISVDLVDVLDANAPTARP